MSPITVERAGLAAALTALSALAKELYGLQVVLEIDPLFDTPIEARVASELYRIVQEATYNVARRAQASLLKIAVHFAASKLNLVIADDGIGLTETSEASIRATGLELRAMRYRAERVGGTFQIDHGSTRGTIIRVSCPLGS
jgi:signal transduction histidine kinase